MNLNACFSSCTDDWKTPTKLYDAFLKRGFIDCFKFHSTYDELLKSYKLKKLFINPPYSKLKTVVNWLENQIPYNLIFLLIPARTDTKYFHKLLEYGPDIIFLRGRLHFNDSNSAPFPSLILIFHGLSTLPTYFFYDLDTFISYLDRFITL